MKKCYADWHHMAWKILFIFKAWSFTKIPDIRVAAIIR